MYLDRSPDRTQGSSRDPAIFFTLNRVVHADFWMGGTDGGGQRSDGGGLARDSRQSRELKKLGFQMLKKRLFVKQNHFIG